jgi:hypothetical protein
MLYNNTPRTYVCDWPGDGGTSATAICTEWPDGTRSYDFGVDLSIYAAATPPNRNKGTLRKVLGVQFRFTSRPVGHDTGYYQRFKRMK